MTYYDVALSFAGEDREIAKVLENELEKNNFKVFFDEFEKEELWGKDLTVELPKKYNSSRFCIMFISELYLEKMWTTFERQVIIEKFLKLKGNDYLLPVRLNGCKRKVPGLSELTGYIDVDSEKDSDFLVELTLRTLNQRLRGKS